MLYHGIEADIYASEKNIVGLFYFRYYVWQTICFSSLLQIRSVSNIRYTVDNYVTHFSLFLMNVYVPYTLLTGTSIAFRPTFSKCFHISSIVLTFDLKRNVIYDEMLTLSMIVWRVVRDVTITSLDSRSARFDSKVGPDRPPNWKNPGLF